MFTEFLSSILTLKMVVNQIEADHGLVPQGEEEVVEAGQGHVLKIAGDASQGQGQGHEEGDQTQGLNGEGETVLIISFLKKYCI
jgi:hypothetical protein